MRLNDVWVTKKLMFEFSARVVKLFTEKCHDGHLLRLPQVPGGFEHRGIHGEAIDHASVYYVIIMAVQFTISYLADAQTILRQYKQMGDRAMQQVADEQLFATLAGEANSIAITVKHMAGNMRSRWTDFLTTDGEKPGRNRDSEFVDPPATRAALIEMWEAGWALVFAAIDGLSDLDLGRTVLIRGEKHSVMQAINRQIAHYASHVGQIVLLAKHFAGERWQSLSIPKGKSEEFLRKPVKR